MRWQITPPSEWNHALHRSKAGKFSGKSQHLKWLDVVAMESGGRFAALPICPFVPPIGAKIANI
ncbi:MAG: hypothetical protein KDK75_20730, partial [Alphaproteobacteria bacterium]|nr:hypothetical protein [Alphaproteobacteria bacterium]